MSYNVYTIYKEEDSKLHSADFKELYSNRFLSFYGESDKIFPMSSMVKNIPMPKSTNRTDSFANTDSTDKKNKSQSIKNAQNLILKLFAIGAAVTYLWINNCIQKRKIEDLKQTVETLAREMDKLQKYLTK